MDQLNTLDLYGERPPEVDELDQVGHSGPCPARLVPDHLGGLLDHVEGLDTYW